MASQNTDCPLLVLSLPQAYMTKLSFAVSNGGGEGWGANTHTHIHSDIHNNLFLMVCVEAVYLYNQN